MSRAALALAVALVLAAAAATGCSGESCEIPTGTERVFVHRIGCEADFVAMSTDRDDAVFAHTLSANVIVDREDGDAVYVIDPDAFLLHYQFARVYLDVPGRTPVGDLGAFNLLNYRRDNRRFLLAKLVHYLDQDLYTYELAAGDTAGVDLIELGYHRIAEAIGVTDDLRYRPVSADQEALLPEIAARIPTVKTADVFGAQVYQPLNRGVGYGVLRFRSTATLSGQPVSPTDIVVLDRVPNDIAMCSAIVTAEFQTPLAHVGILAKTRGTPNMAVRDGWNEPRLRAFEDQLVKLEVGPQDYTITAANPAEAQAYWDSLRPAEVQIPAHDSVSQPMLDVTLARSTDAIRIGSKAANLGELFGVHTTGARPIPTPDRPFAIPFFHYAAHIASAGVQPMIDAVIADYAAGTLDPAALEARLFAIRWAIYRAPIEPTLLATVVARIRDRWPDDAKLRFRSSTNVEDLEDFTGAGLYTSASGTLAEGDVAIANAIKTVWASVWNSQAFVERDFYRVDHHEVRMGVLIHPASDDLVNGVAVTINEFSELRPAFYINSQLGDVSVTNPTGDAISEQILYYTWYEEPEYEVITRSSLLPWAVDWPSTTSLMTNAELDELAEYLSAIHAAFRARYPMTAVDVEFKLTADRKILIKQARPYKPRAPE